MALALVNPADLITSRAEDSTIDLAEPMKAGWRWLPIVEVQAGIAEGPDTVTTGPVTAVETTRVTETWTTRALTAAEIDTRNTARAAVLGDEELGKLFLSAFRTMHALWKQDVPNGTVAQFNTFVNNATASNDITVTAFRNWIKARL